MEVHIHDYPSFTPHIPDTTVAREFYNSQVITNLTARTGFQIPRELAHLLSQQWFCYCACEFSGKQQSFLDGMTQEIRFLFPSYVDKVLAGSYLVSIAISRLRIY